MALTAYKAFNADWTCNGFQYEVGKTYEHKGHVSMCNSGFHACTVPFDCWHYYERSATFARVRLDGVSDDTREDSKRVGAKITIEAGLTLPEWIKAQTEAVVDLCRAAKKSLASKSDECAAATGYSGHAAATGYSGHAAATGYRGHAAATGYKGHAAATGKNSIAAALGINATAQGAKGTWLVLARHDDDWNLIEVKTAKVGEDGIKPDTAYRLNAEGAFVPATAE